MNDVLKKMQTAMNDRDLDALVDCFTEDYRCEIPLHPARDFVGREHVRTNWGAIFMHVPDLRARILRWTGDGDTVWSEWEITGTTTADTPHLVRGVVVAMLAGDRIGSTRFYLEPVTA
ncbi:nuclear transport factor 2 family protein [Pseudonocardia acaciae]|uniref:nuclear transport factor 2 family protein n=1 Tax=Pseudonocardia acaciae TaxID=551276 RepID=UPI00068553B9|nr:nuclear transport factor 2 family protein [Pseudonocardia acaciae]